MAEIKAGDCVELKHGGGKVQMTVESVDKYQDGTKAKCTYFNSTSMGFVSHLFYPEALKLCGEK